jgi:hypothetical protein
VSDETSNIIITMGFMVYLLLKRVKRNTIKVKRRIVRENMYSIFIPSKGYTSTTLLKNE